MNYIISICLIADIFKKISARLSAIINGINDIYYDLLHFLSSVP